MIKVSEYVSVGHPDKVADYISQHLLDRYIEKDPNTRYAVEVQVKDNHVCLGGEVTSKCELSMYEIRTAVREAVRCIGYTAEYASAWGKDENGLPNCMNAEALNIDVFISQQSPDIAQGLNGWGDQGIFFGYAEPDERYGMMPKDHALAKRLCKALYESGIGGLDIKTQVVIDGEDVSKVIVAIPLLPNGQDAEDVEHFVRYILDAEGIKRGYELIVNGTGAYVRHSSIADCGTTGRKLAVDFYGGNAPIGGGSPWTKDASKADLTLNLLARLLAKHYAKEYDVPVLVSLGCCIGRQEVTFCVRDTADNVLVEGEYKVDPERLRHAFHLDKPIYASMCEWGFFGCYQSDKPWENIETAKQFLP